MAFTLFGYESIVDFKDRGANTTRRTYRLAGTDDAGDISDLITAQNNLIAKLIAISNAGITAVRMARVTINDAFTLPDTGEVENNARFTMKINGIPNKSATLDVPAPVDAIFAGTSGKLYNQVNMANTDVVNFLDIFTGPTPTYTVSDGEAITQTAGEGKRIHKHSTRG